jgi:hypothetical protein
MAEAKPNAMSALEAAGDGGGLAAGLGLMGDEGGDGLLRCGQRLEVAVRAPGAKDSPVGIVGAAGGGRLFGLGEGAGGLEVLVRNERASVGGQGDEIVHRGLGWGDGKELIDRKEYRTISSQTPLLLSSQSA